MHRPARGPKKLRRKGPVVSDDEDDGEKVQQPADAGGGAALESNKTASGPNRPAQASRRPGAKMSFDLEEEGADIPIKAKKLLPPGSNRPSGRKLLRKSQTKSEESEAKKPVPVAVLQRSRAGEYTPEKLAELRKNSKTISFSSAIRPSMPPPDWPTTEPPVDVATVEEELPPGGSGRVNDQEDIPSHAEVVRARQRRERMREMTGIIPLEDTSFSKELDTDEINSRLVRDDEEDPEPDIFEDEKGARIAFGDPKERERRQKSTLLEQIKRAEEDDSEDEEIRRWELEQIKKGVRGGKELRKAALERMKQPKHDHEKDTSQRSVSVSEHATGVLSSARVQLPSVEDVQKSLRQALERLEASHSNEEKELHQVKHSVATSESNVDDLSKQLNIASAEFDYYQRLRDYILDLLDCLREKSRDIEECHTASEALFVGRYAKRKQNHYLAVQDQIEEIERARGDLVIKDEPEIAVLKQRRREHLLARSEARKQRLARKSPRVEDEEGWSSDDDDKQEEADFDRSREALLSRASGIFEDVVDEFSTLSAIKQRFEQWRSQHTAGYHKCFAGMSLVDICVPYVKLQMLTWDPLGTDPSNFEDQEWYTTLSAFDLNSEMAQKNEEGNDLVPGLVRRVVLPKARAFISKGWDPRSRVQTLRVQSLVRNLLPYIPAQSDVKALLQAVMVALQADVDRVRLPTAYLSLSEDANRLAMAEFWSTVKVMSNIASWHEQLSNRALRSMALDKLLNGQIVPFLRQIKFAATSAGIRRFVEVNEPVLEAIPHHWFVPEREEGLVTPEARVYHGWALQQWRTLKRDGPRDLPPELLQRLAHIFTRLNDLETPRQVLE